MPLQPISFFSPSVSHPRHTVQNRPFSEIGWCFFDDVPDGSSWNIHEYWGVWRILPRKSGIYRACPFGRFWHGKSPQTPKCRRLQAPWSMAGAEGLEPSARGFGGNVEISLTLRLLPDFGDLLPAAPLMLQELMLFWWCSEFCTRFLMLLMMNSDSTVCGLRWEWGSMTISKIADRQCSKFASH